MQWKRQGSAILRVVGLRDGRKGIVVIIGTAEKDYNAVVVFQKEGGEKEIIPVSRLIDLIPPEDVIDIYCTQERVFGKRAFVPLKIV